MFTSGFFDSVGTDRTYTSESFNTFFEGLISDNGIFEGVDGAFSVTPNTNLQMQIASGKALVNCHWIKSDASEVITLDTAHNLFNRYDMITLRWDNTTRAITLEKTKGEESSAETKPQPIRTTTQYEIVLAYVYVKANATAITNADIQDCRYDTELCGVITGLIDQVDTTSLYRQYSAQFQDLVNQMETWQQTQKEAYTEWFNSLTGGLFTDIKLRRTTANYLTTREDGTQYIDLPSALDYTEGDILDVFVNGVLLVEGADYDLTMNEVENIPMIFIYSDVEKDNLITFYCIKSALGSITAE